MGKPGGIPSKLPDLSQLGLDDLSGHPPMPDALALLLARLEEPSSSISGYNPQRLD